MQEHPDLPELVDLIPLLYGDVYSYHGGTYFAPNNMKEVLMVHIDGPGLDLIRVGVRVYEVLEYDNEAKAFRVRQFRCNLSELDLMRLSEQAVEDG